MRSTVELRYLGDPLGLVCGLSKGLLGSEFRSAGSGLLVTIDIHVIRYLGFRSPIMIDGFGRRDATVG